MEKVIEQKLDFFFTQSKPIFYKKGEMIIRAEDPIFGIFYLKKGLVRQFLISPDGVEITLHIFKPISFFPMMLALDRTSNRYSFQAITPVELWRQRPEKVIEFLKMEPDVLLDLSTRFASGLNGLALRIEQLLLDGAYKRLVSLLLYLAGRFGKPAEDSVIIDLPLTHNDIAAWIGTSRETASRQMEKLTRKRVISSQRHMIIVNNLKKLEKEIE